MVKPNALLLHIEEAALLLSFSRSTIYELIAAGELHPIKIGRAVRLKVSDLEDWVTRQLASA